MGGFFFLVSPPFFLYKKKRKVSNTMTTTTTTTRRAWTLLLQNGRRGWSSSSEIIPAAAAGAAAPFSAHFQQQRLSALSHHHHHHHHHHLSSRRYASSVGKISEERKLARNIGISAFFFFCLALRRAFCFRLPFVSFRSMISMFSFLFLLNSAGGRLWGAMTMTLRLIILLISLLSARSLEHFVSRSFLCVCVNLTFITPFHAIQARTLTLGKQL
jgi:hypothetical protein